MQCSALQPLPTLLRTEVATIERRTVKTCKDQYSYSEQVKTAQQNSHRLTRHFLLSAEQLLRALFYWFERVNLEQ
jgi:hypothetical protein